MKSQRRRLSRRRQAGRPASATQYRGTNSRGPELFLLLAVVVMVVCLTLTVGLQFGPPIVEVLTTAELVDVFVA